MRPAQALKNTAKDAIDWEMVAKYFPGGMIEEQRTKFSIFYAAARLFAARGYRGTAVREIVQAAGVTKPTLYYYFANKEDLFVQLMGMAMETSGQVLERAVAHPGSPKDRLMNFFTEMFVLLQGNLDFLRLVNISLYAPPGATPFYDMRPTHEKFLSAFQQMLHAEGKPPLSEIGRETAIALLLGLLRSIQIHFVKPELGPPVTLARIEEIVDFILRAACIAEGENKRK